MAARTRELAALGPADGSRPRTRNRRGARRTRASSSWARVGPTTTAPVMARPRTLGLTSAPSAT
eukprot:1674237-Alexandrium_andersonii.AAC.1